MYPSTKFYYSEGLPFCCAFYCSSWSCKKLAVERSSAPFNGLLLVFCSSNASIDDRSCFGDFISALSFVGFFMLEIEELLDFDDCESTDEVISNSLITGSFCISGVFFSIKGRRLLDCNSSDLADCSSGVLYLLNLEGAS